MSTNWITLSQTAGTGNQVVTVSAATNEVMSERNLRIKITTGGKTEYVFVTQDAAPLMVTRIEFTGVSLPPISYTGGTLTASDGRYNITAYYNDGSEVPQVAATVTGNSFSSSAINASLSVVSAGTMNLTASFSGKSASTTYTVMQMGVPEGRYIEYSGNSQVNVSGNWSSTGTTNVIANSYSGGSGLIVFDNVADYIPTEAFANQTGLTWVVLPSTIDEISSDVFSGCSSLTSIEYDGTIDEFEDITKDSAWMDGSSIEYVQCTDGIIDYYFDYIYIANVQPFYIPYSGGTVNPLSREYVVKGVYCDGTEVEIDNSEIVFSGSPVTINTVNTASTATLVSAATIIASYSGVSASTTLTASTSIPIYEDLVPKNNRLIYSGSTTVSPRVNMGVNIIATNFENGVGIIVFDDQLTEIPINAFSGYTSLTGVEIPDGVELINNSAFYNCTSLSNVIIGSGVTEISPNSTGSIRSYGAFEGCTSLSSITIPDNVITIGHQAFHNCTSLTNVNLGNGLTSLNNPSFEVEYGVFQGCTSLSSITLPSSLTLIGGLTFAGTSLSSITIPDSVTEIMPMAFSYCPQLTNVIIGSGVTNLWPWCFDGSYSLTSITYNGTKAQWETISDDFSWDGDFISTIHCTDGDIYLLKYFTITGTRKPNINLSLFSPTALTHTFYQNSEVNLGIGTISFPISNVTEIKNEAFMQCTSISSITIPNSVTEIGEDVFLNCDLLTSINYNDTMSQWNNITKHINWNRGSSLQVIHCTDGDISV